MAFTWIWVHSSTYLDRRRRRSPFLHGDASYNFHQGNWNTNNYILDLSPTPGENQINKNVFFSVNSHFAVFCSFFFLFCFWTSVVLFSISCFHPNSTFQVPISSLNACHIFSCYPTITALLIYIADINTKWENVRENITQQLFLSFQRGRLYVLTFWELLWLIARVRKVHYWERVHFYARVRLIR